MKIPTTSQIYVLFAIFRISKKSCYLSWAENLLSLTIYYSAIFHESVTVFLGPSSECASFLTVSFAERHRSLVKR